MILVFVSRSKTDTWKQISLLNSNLKTAVEFRKFSGYEEVSLLINVLLQVVNSSFNIFFLIFFHFLQHRFSVSW